MNGDVLSRFFSFYVAISVLTTDQTINGFSLTDYNFSNLTRVSRQTNECNGFRCLTSRECIEDDQKCDGIVDCTDGSDEFNDCKDIQCPGYLFTCDYGACIEMIKKCNGKKDCRDNSDEANCIDSNSNKISSNCKSDQFECKSGQCIPLDDKCSGTPECDDKSDETKETCLNMYCPGYTFKCDYGACANGDAKCNGVKDCVDNSDEEDCDVIPTPTPGPKPKPKPTPTPTPAPTSGTGPCELPEFPQYGQWSVIGGAQIAPKQKVAKDTIIRYECSSGFKLSIETQYVACTEKGWSVPEIPKCLPVCPPLYTTPVINLQCMDNRGIEIKCDSATHGASATFSCQPYYESADRAKATRYCWNGSWNLPPPVCQPVCGEKKVSAEPLIVNGQKVEKGNYPWVTAIYQKVGNAFVNVCGGSMLTQKVIITAAHCVTYDNGNLLPKDIIRIAVGKYYNKYKDERDTQAQYSEIETMHIRPTYKGDAQRFASDIALLITKDILLLSKVVQPVCYQDVQSFNLDVGLTGVVTGWGFTVASDTPSDELLEIEVPYKPESVCYQELPNDWADKYVTFDKMCAGHYNKSIAVCKGDSGGGLVFQNYRDNRYYIQGIVSVGHGNKGGCNIQVSALYTKVAAHYDWIEKIVSQYLLVNN